MTGDLLAHCIDTAIWLNGGITDVTRDDRDLRQGAQAHRHRQGGEVGIDDACAFLCHFDNGSLGLFESTRYARGHKALYTLEINGENGSLKWDLHDLHRLQWFDHSDEGQLRGWRRSTSPTATIPTWASGGCRACRSATSTASSTRSPTSSKACAAASRPRRPSATRSRRRRSATRSSSPASPEVGRRGLSDMAAPKSYDAFLDALGERESSGNYGAVNTLGFLGKYQFGEAALTDVGYYSADGTAANDWQAGRLHRQGRHRLEGRLPRRSGGAGKRDPRLHEAPVAVSRRCPRL